MEDETVMRVEGVTKRYGDLVALDEVNLAIEPGEIFALLGPNGAGKTTLIGCSTGLIQDFEGSIRIGGFDVRQDATITRRLVGLVPQELNFDGFFNARQALFYQSGYYGIKPDPVKIDRMLRDFSLDEKAEQNTRKLSGGMKRRLMICKALMHDPALLFLDEPTAGVDVELREDLWNYVRMLRNEGMTIILTTHYLEEAEQLADRIGIVDRGKILRVQSREDLLADLGRRWISIRFENTVRASDFDALNVDRVDREDDCTLRFELTAAVDNTRHEHVLGEIVDRSREIGNFIRNVDTGRSSLEEVFRSILVEKGGEK